MDPITITALVGLGKKALEVGVDAWKAWLANGSGGVAVSSNGSRYALTSNGLHGAVRSGTPTSGIGQPISFEAQFVPADPWAHAYLDGDQPVLLVIEGQDERSSLDALVALATLDSGFEGSLYPGTYLLGAFVFLDEDPDNWSDVDGGALLEFSVVAGERPFLLDIPIEAVTGPADILEASETLVWSAGHLRAGGEDYYDALFESGMTYQIYVAPRDPRADFDLFVYDENGNRVAFDDDPDSDALCTITPLWTGPFSVVVKCHNGASDYEVLVQG